jgi:hypothetical protein
MEFSSRISGRIHRTSIKASSSPNVARTRADRRNAAKQIQLKKRHDLIEAIRIFSGVDGAPRIVAVIPLCPDTEAAGAVRAMVSPFEADTTDMPSSGSWRFRSVFSPSNESLTPTLSHFQSRPLQNQCSFPPPSLSRSLQHARRVQGGGLCHLRAVYRGRGGYMGRYCSSMSPSSRPSRRHHCRDCE